MAYPVRYEVERPERYNRLTVLFRWLLAIPHLILVGGLGLSIGVGTSGAYRDNEWLQALISIINAGILTTVAGILVFIAWWAILFTGRFPESFRNFVIMVYRWAMNVHAYVYLQTERYPPFSGEQPYDLQVQVTPAEEHNRLTVLVRIFLVIPHIVVLFFLGIAQAAVTFVAWIVTLITAEYPAGLYSFSVGVSRWYARVYAYMYLLVDEYPPFTLSSEQSQPDIQPRMA